MKSEHRLSRVLTIECYKSTFCVLAAVVYVVVVKYLTAKEKEGTIEEHEKGTHSKLLASNLQFLFIVLV